MKNTIIIDIDTERETQLEIRKPTDVQQPSTTEDAKSMMLNDLSCIHETFKYMIKVADHNGYAKKNEVINTAIKDLQSLLDGNQE